MSKNEIVIKSVDKGSIAEKLGIVPRDVLVGINDEIVNDTIEYRYLICDEHIRMVLKKNSGEEVEIDFMKDAYEDIGIEFDDPFLDNALSCTNKCIFCFIDQLPKGMRKSLYFKDDDSRLSFLQGNFITLTNLKDDDFRRIIKYKISPINVSVHTTNPELRTEMLKNKRASNIIDRLKGLTDGGIRLNCQIVLCPGINDGVELKRTLRDLFEFYPRISNVAIVPVGITKYREGLYPMEGYTEITALSVIKEVEEMQSMFFHKVNEPFARLGDEFYITAKVKVPEEEHYGDFEQIEDGIGMLRYFETRVNEDIDSIELDGNNIRIAFLTGEMCSEFLTGICKKIERKFNLNISLYIIRNNFFGGKVSVAGLVTGTDIIEQTSGKLTESITFLPRNMLKADEEIFLDDITLKELEEALNTKIIVCQYTGEDLIEKLRYEVLKWQNR